MSELEDLKELENLKELLLVGDAVVRGMELQLELLKKYFPNPSPDRIEYILQLQAEINLRKTMLALVQDLVGSWDTKSQGVEVIDLRGLKK